MERSPCTQMRSGEEDEEEGEDENQRWSTSQISLRGFGSARDSLHSPRPLARIGPFCLSKSIHDDEEEEGIEEAAHAISRYPGR